jgi:hypothetical protein
MSRKKLPLTCGKKEYLIIYTRGYKAGKAFGEQVGTKKANRQFKEGLVQAMEENNIALRDLYTELYPASELLS